MASVVVSLRFEDELIARIDQEAATAGVKRAHYLHDLVATMLHPEKVVEHTVKADVKTRTGGYRLEDRTARCPHPPRMRVNGAMPQCLACGEFL